MIPNLSNTQTQQPSNGGWQRMFVRYDIQFLVLDILSDSTMVQLFQSQPGWAVDYKDEEAVIFVRSEIG